MVAEAYYGLILGIVTNLERIPVKRNPNYIGPGDNVNPFYVRANEGDDNTWGDSYVFPNEALVKNLERNGQISKDVSANPLEELVLKHDDFWLEDMGKPFQILGIELESHAGGGLLPANEEQIKRGLEMKGKVAEMINRYGFKITEADIRLHQVLLPYDD